MIDAVVCRLSSIEALLADIHKNTSGIRIGARGIMATRWGVAAAVLVFLIYYGTKWDIRRRELAVEKSRFVRVAP